MAENHTAQSFGIIQPVGFPPLPASWNTELETYRSYDDKLKLCAATHSRQDLSRLKRAVRVLALSHGIGEHGGRYLHFPSLLNDTVDLVFCPDHRGHGRSEGLRGHVERFKDFSEDFRHGLERLMEKHKDADLEIHLLGHSMGSLVAMHLALDHPQLPLRSVTLSSPLFGVSVEVPLVKRAAAGILSDLWGKLQMKTGLNAENLSHDPAVIEAYRKDRLVHELCTPRLYTEMMSAMKNAAKRPGEIAFPTLMQVPMADKIVDPEAAITYHRASQKTELKTYAGFFHESYNETGKQQPFEDLKTWITHNTTQHSVLS